MAKAKQSATRTFIAKPKKKDLEYTVRKTK